MQGYLVYDLVIHCHSRRRYENDQMRTTKVISITVPPDMAAEAKKLAKKESRTMSELMREAFRRYKRERELDEINAYGRENAKDLGITSEQDMVRVVREYRREQRQKKTGTK